MKEFAKVMSMTTPASRARLGALGVSLILLALSVWGLATEEPPSSGAQAIILIDASLSNTPQERCADVARMVTGLLSRGEALRLTLLATGDHGTGDEPVEVGRVHFARPTKIVEGKGRAAAARTAALQEVERLCAGVPGRQESPIFQGLSTALLYFREAQCGAPGSRCELYVRSDGLEEKDMAIRQALAGHGRPHAPRLENNNIAVHFSGLSARRMSAHEKSPPDIRAVEAAFRPEFTRPDLVEFTPAVGALGEASPVRR